MGASDGPERGVIEQISYINLDHIVPQRIETLKKLRDPRLLHFSGIALVDRNPERAGTLRVNETVLIKKAGVYEEDDDVFLIKIAVDTEIYTGTAIEFTVKPGIINLGEKQRLIVYGLAASYCEGRPNNFPLFKYNWDDSISVPPYREEFKRFVAEAYRPPSDLDMTYRIIKVFEDPSVRYSDATG